MTPDREAVERLMNTVQNYCAASFCELTCAEQMPGGFERWCGSCLMMALHSRCEAAEAERDEHKAMMFCTPGCPYGGSTIEELAEIAKEKP